MIPARQPPRVRLGVVGSTNDEARGLAIQGAVDGTVVTADAQTSGRGRRGTTWNSPKGNLHLSMILRPGGSPARTGQLTYVASLALAEAIDSALPHGPQARVKWPNDVLVDGGKVAGILLESETLGGSVSWVVVGIGVNVSAYPIDTRLPAISLAARGATVGSDVLADLVIERMGAWRARWELDGFPPIRAAWLARAVGLGGAIRVNLERESFAARFAAIDDDGALVAELADGTRRLVTAGEIALGTAA